MQILFNIIKNPHFYIFIGILVLFILCLIFHKRIKDILKGCKINLRKTNTLTLDYTDTTQNSKSKKAIEIKNIEMENSMASDIEGNVYIDNVKMKNSNIGSVRGR